MNFMTIELADRRSAKGFERRSYAVSAATHLSTFRGARPEALRFRSARRQHFIALAVRSWRDIANTDDASGDDDMAVNYGITPGIKRRAACAEEEGLRVMLRVGNKHRHVAADSRIGRLSAPCALTALCFQWA